MKRKLLPGSLILAAALIMSVVASKNAASQDKPITVLNPAISEKLAARTPLVPRLNKLEGKTIYLVDMNYEGFGRTAVLYEMQNWIAQNMPGVKTILKLKSGSYISDDPVLWKEIAANKADGVIIGVAG